MKKPREPDEEHRRSTMDDVSLDFCDRSSSSSRRSSRTFSKRTARHSTSRKRTYDQLRSRSTASTATEFDRFERFWEESDNDRLRRRRKKDREAARVAVGQIQNTAGFEINCEAEKELESMCECSAYYVLDRHPLNSLGLFLKPDYSDINDEEQEATMFRDIYRTKKPYIHMGRSAVQHKVEKEEYKDHDRVTMLKLRYKDTIRKAQKALGLPDYEKQEGIGLKITEACSWSNTTTTESDQFHKFREEIDCDRLRRRIERHREAARVAVDGIRDTADLEDNHYAEKELESMCECSSYYVLGRSPLISLGLFLKPEYSDINEEEAILFGDIRRTKKPYIYMGRSMQHSTSSPRKDHDRVEMLKLRYKDIISKAQRALGLPDSEARPPFTLQLEALHLHRESIDSDHEDLKIDLGVY